ncbi:alginate O-acetyltransferase AlgX-related protein [Kineosporia babensis]|uniref:AlgX/AlgJ SGNH hydrolase-like domain-containing protein n=1 Tax=Kineosporia babensis TaxID=499548 RepID=A0A9X1NLU3_9ACTN|nr:hypothetical protein [Kineosporia babensis]
MGRTIILPDDDEPENPPGVGHRAAESAATFGRLGPVGGPSTPHSSHASGSPTGPAAHHSVQRSSGLAVRSAEHPDRLEVIHHPAPEARVDNPPATPEPRDCGTTEPEATDPVLKHSTEKHPTGSRPPEKQPAENQPAEPEEPAPHSATEELDDLLARFRAERQRRRSVRAARVLVAGFAAALLAVWLLDPPMPWGEENRKITSFPDVSPSGLLSGADSQQTDEALRDRLALRQYVTEAIGQASRDRLGTSLNPAVVLGRNRTPFLSEDFTLPCKHDFDPAPVAAGLDRLTGIAQANGKSLMVAIAPDKSAIMSGVLGKRADALLACSEQVRTQTEQTWAADPDGPVVISWDQLQAAQDEDPGSVFQKGDSHWTSKGALVWSKTVLDALIARGEAPGSLAGAPKAVQVKDEKADNDLYRLMGISRNTMVPVYQVTRDDVTIRAHTEQSPSGRGVAVFRAWSTTAPMIKGRTLVVNDSFISRAEGLLAPYFTKLEVMHWSDFLTAVEEGELPEFDRIIIETVQRGWPQRAGWLVEGQPMHQALAEQLGTPKTPKKK